MKRIAAFILALIVIAVSGCNGKGNAQTTTESTAAPSEAWDYEMYIGDLDYYMEQYIQLYDSARDAFRLQDATATRSYLEEEIDALTSLENVIYPPELEEVHNELLYAAGLEKELAESNIELTSYIDISGNLTAEEQSSLDNLYAEAEEILTKIEDGGDILEAWTNAKKAAFSYLPNGEYRFYSMNLEIQCNKYVTKFNELYEVFFNGAEGDALAISEDCLETLSAIETMEVPEQVKPYHDDIIEAISVEREYCLAVKTIKELNNEYQGLAFEDTPADVQEQINKCSEIINGYFDEENAEFDALYNAVTAAGEFADAQAGQ